MKSVKKIKIKLIRSSAGQSHRQKETVRGLGFTRLHQEREIIDTPASRGMVNKICHMVRIIEEGK